MFLADHSTAVPGSIIFVHKFLASSVFCTVGVWVERVGVKRVHSCVLVAIIIIFRYSKAKERNNLAYKQCRMNSFIIIYH